MKGQKILKVLPFLCTLLFLGTAVLFAVYKIKYRVYDFPPMLAIIALLFVLSRVYLAHEKNVMKAALSAILAILCSWELYYVADSVNFLFLTEDAVGEFYDWFSFAVRIISGGLLLLIMTYHFLLTSEHKSNPRRIRANGVALILVVAIFVIMLGYDIINFAGATPGAKWWGVELSTICIRLFETFALLEVFRIDMLLDMFRRKREEA